MMVPGHLWPPDTTAAARKALRRRIDRLGVHVVALNTPTVDMNVAGLAAETRRYTLDLLHGIVELAGDLGVPGVVIGPGKANPLLQAPKERLTDHFLAALDELCPRAKKVGTALWVENLPFAFLPKIGELMDVLDTYGSPDVGIVWDAANSHFAHEDLGQSLRRCRERLQLVHLSDTNRWRYRHDAVGLGTVPFAEIPPVLMGIGYNKRTILEVISDDADRDIVASAQRLAAEGFTVPVSKGKRARTAKA
ncbi:MAG: sugar phosphate isomerase/epimerase [Hyphomonadaceae bacterium]|nr:sugar phosphate isomerase/epimerase [Hyphomonadaceae bacterium]